MACDGGTPNQGRRKQGYVQYFTTGFRVLDIEVFIFFFLIGISSLCNILKCIITLKIKTVE
jgi:hypothetical protein